MSLGVPTAPPPGAVRVCAAAMLLVAGGGLLLVLMASGDARGRGVGEVGQLIDKAAAKGNEKEREQARQVKRALDLKAGMDADLAARRPLAKTHEQADRTVELFTSALLAVSGVMLLQRKEAGRLVAFAYCAVSLVQKVANMAYLWLYEVPARLEYLDGQTKFAPADAAIIKIARDELSKGPLTQLVLAAFPLAVLGVMLQRATVAYLRWRDAPPMPSLPLGDGSPPTLDEVEALLRQRHGQRPDGGW